MVSRAQNNQIRYAVVLSHGKRNDMVDLCKMNAILSAFISPTYLTTMIVVLLEFVQ